MRIKLTNGLILEGDFELLKETTAKLEIADGLGDSKYYNSSTHGRIEISKMSNAHLKNAILKLGKEWITSLYKLNSTEELWSALQEGATNITLRSLMEELGRRTADCDKGEWDYHY